LDLYINPSSFLTFYLNSSLFEFSEIPKYQAACVPLPLPLMLETELRALHILCKCSTTEVHPEPKLFVFESIIDSLGLALEILTKCIWNGAKNFVV
jgi:hypothetical protein